MHKLTLAAPPCLSLVMAFLVAAVGCPAPSTSEGEGEGAAAGEGEGEGEGAPAAVTSEYASAGVGAWRFTLAPHADGSRTLHADAHFELSAFFGGETASIDAVEDAEVDATGDITSADIQHEIHLGTTVIARRAIVDGLARTVTVHRPSGDVVIDATGTGPIVPAFTHIDQGLAVSLTSPLSCALLVGTIRTSTNLTLVDAGLGLSLDLPAGPSTAPVGQLFLGGDECDYAADDDSVTAIKTVALGTFTPDGTAPTAPLATLDVAATGNALSAPACATPAHSEQFTATSTDASGFTVPGQIDLPDGAGPFPTVIINSGTGGSDRNGAFFTIPAYTCLSDALTAHGIAVARYDDPGHGAAAAESFGALSLVDRDDDAIAVADLIRERGDVSQLYLLGHSEGVAHAARAAPHVSGGVDGLIFIAGIGNNGGDALIEQNRAVWLNHGFSSTVVDSLTQGTVQFVAQVNAGTFTGAPPEGLSLTFWQQFFQMNGADDAAAAHVPTLILQGTCDWQVVPDNAQRLSDAITAAGESDVTVHMVDNVGHFQSPCPLGLAGIGEEYGAPFAFADDDVNAIEDWIDTRP